MGDTKQSIMGFQGADPRLTEALQAAHPETVTPLYRNWRSDPRIMAMVNTLGPTLFDNYNPLAPQRAETGETALEVLDLPKGRKDTTAECIANRVADILKPWPASWARVPSRPGPGPCPGAGGGGGTGGSGGVGSGRRTWADPCGLEDSNLKS